MLAKVQNKVKFIEVENRTSRKNGNAYQMIIVVDLEKFDKFEFFKRDDLVLDGVSNGDIVDITLDISRNGYNTNVDLTNIIKAK